MTETYGSLIDSIQSQLQGFVTDPPMFGTLVGAVSATDTQLSLAVADQCQPQGVIEIDDELLYVLSYDTATGVATVPAWGRGQQGTTAAAHAAGAKVSVNPKYPRRRVGQAINATINAMCPPLFGVTVGSVQAQYLTWEYALPTQTEALIRVEYLPWNATQYDWRPLREAFIKRDTGVPVLHMPTRAGFLASEVRWTVSTNPLPFTDPSQPYSYCGLQDSSIDCVMLGAIPRLVTTSELARQQLTTTESSDRATLVPTGSGTSAAKFYYALFQDRLKDEAAGLRRQYPITMMRVP